MDPLIKKIALDCGFYIMTDGVTGQSAFRCDPARSMACMQLFAETIINTCANISRGRGHDGDARDMEAHFGYGCDEEFNEQYVELIMSQLKNKGPHRES